MARCNRAVHGTLHLCYPRFTDNKRRSTNYHRRRPCLLPSPRDERRPHSRPFHHIPPQNVFWGRVGFLGFSHQSGEFGENFFSLGAPWGAAFIGDPPQLLLQPRSRPSFPFWRGLPPVFWGSQAKDLKPTRGLARRGDKIQLLANAGCFGGFRN